MRSWFVDPVVLVLAVACLGLMIGVKWRRAGLVLAATAVALLYVLATPFVSGHLLASAEVPYRALSEPSTGQTPPAAIVVLSAGITRAAPEYGGDTVDRLTLERLRYAAHVQRQTGLPVLVTGGHVEGVEASLGQLMKAVLERDFDVPVRWVEARSANTYENARFSADLLKTEGIHTVVLVTHAFHMRRAREAFQAAGIDVVPASTGFTYNGPGVRARDMIPNARALGDSAYAMHELVGRVVYLILY